MASCSYISQEDQEKFTLAKFSHGRLQRHAEGTWRKTPSFSLLKSSESDDPRKSLRRILVADGDSMQYVGQNYGDQASKANSMCKYFVGVLDKKRGKMKVYDAQLLELHPWLGKKESKAEEEESKDLSYAEKQDRLTEAFGSSRKQRAMESRLRGQVGSEALESSAAKALSHAGSLTSTPIKEDQGTSDLLPPHDPTATLLQDVFKLHDLISPTHWDVLKPLAEELISGAVKNASEWKASKKYPHYVLNHLTGLSHLQENRQTTQAVCLVYVSFLMQLHKTHPKDMKGKKCLPGVPRDIRAHLFESFTQMVPTPDGKREDRFLPKRLKDKLLSYILVLAQLIDSFHTEVTTLSEDLGIPVKKLITHARAIGCRTVTQTVASPAQLRRKRQIKRDPDDDDDDDYDLATTSISKGLAQKALFIELSAPLQRMSTGGGKRPFGGRR
ncbi:DNA-directed RNA polymerase I subunit RPA49-like [Diadema antillarum]|uniref:DNA-directed RNA polymerase I subunit RPA49-like n=1 Tax=Diadema antillarum TaxID=105358 RepID=UPI003A8BD8E6